MIQPIVAVESRTLSNDNFREVIYTATHMQLVVMSLLPSEDIGMEMHELDQFVRVVSGTGKAVLDGVEYALPEGSAVIVGQGTEHNIINMSDTMPLKLYSIYAPPNHLEGTIHPTKADAENDDEHFDGVTSIAM